MSSTKCLIEIKIHFLHHNTLLTILQKKKLKSQAYLIIDAVPIKSSVSVSGWKLMIQVKNTGTFLGNTLNLYASQSMKQFSLYTLKYLAQPTFRSYKFFFWIILIHHFWKTYTSALLSYRTTPSPPLEDNTVPSLSEVFAISYLTQKYASGHLSRQTHLLWLPFPTPLLSLQLLSLTQKCLEGEMVRWQVCEVRPHGKGWVEAFGGADGRQWTARCLFDPSLLLIVITNTSKNQY